VHDHASCQSLQTGNLALWSARECGSHWVWIIAPDDHLDVSTLDNLRTRLSYFDAVDAIWPGGQWVLIESTHEQSGEVIACTTEEARALLLDRLRTVEQKAPSEPIPA
jgi:hypothetical protein